MSTYLVKLKQVFCVLAFFIAVFLTVGCSVSTSSGSISDSTSSILSSPSSVSGINKKYPNEVADYTLAYVKSSRPNDSYSSFLRGLSDIAAKEGITNWEQDSLTYRGIGKGLKKANVNETVYETFKNNIANGDPKKIENIQSGYDSND